jgi:hypothetical protein
MSHGTLAYHELRDKEEVWLSLKLDNRYVFGHEKSIRKARKYKNTK